MIKQPLKVMTYNVGAFNGGTATPHPNDDNLSSDFLAWTQFFGKNNVDILFVQEDSDYFDVDSTINAYDNIYANWYKFAVIDAYGQYRANRIYSKYPLSDGQMVYFKVQSNSDTTKKRYTKAYMMIGNIKVLLISAHLTVTDLDSRREQLNELKKMADSEKYFIIGADFNIVSGDEFDIFDSYNKANCGKFGTFATSQNSGLPRDNIITNIPMMYSDMLDFDKSDHYALYTDLDLEIKF